MVTAAPSQVRTRTAYDAELARAREDVDALETICRRNLRDVEKRVRLAYRQFHLASLTGMETDFESVQGTIAAILREFGPKEDVCLLKATLDGRFHRLEAVKQDLAMCPLLSGRFAGRSMLADVDFQEGRYEQARAAFEVLIKENRTWDNLARLAHWKGKMGEPDEADRLYEEAEDELTAKEMRSFAWVKLQRGALALSRELNHEARAHYERASAAFPGDWRTDAHRADLLAAEGDYDQALELLRGVVGRAPKPELQQALGELLLFLGRKDEAQPWLGNALEAYLASAQKGDVHYYHHLADFYADAGGKPAEAVKWASQDAALRSNFSTQSALAWALFRNGEIAEGLKWIDLALSSGAQEAGLFATAASLFEAAGDKTQSERCKRAASTINPRQRPFHIHL